MKKKMTEHGRHVWAKIKTGFWAWTLVVKMYLPALFLTRILLYYDLIPYVAVLFRPLMGLVGLPPEMALAWVGGMVGNLYITLAIYLSLLPVTGPLSLAQLTTLASLGLLAHGLLVEGQICRATGISFWRVTVFRLVSALAFGMIIHAFSQVSGWGREPVALTAVLSSFTTELAPGWGAWLLNAVEQLLMILVLVEVLMLLMELVKWSGLTRLISKILGPPLRFAGVGESAIMVTIIGCVVGLAYGGGLIVAESRSGSLKPEDIFGGMMLMAVFHSIIEDTLVMWAMGASLWCLLGARLVFALLLMSLITRLARRPFWRPILVGDHLSGRAG